ncbi:hypothetical protein FA95DRAFT_211669 [Auriscalpium vulgare]|uniref:Uncharacterized protein n=1 Tax=Auriscalpium vulgare TaxID=40419 RepID=A0ACB8RME0_9AGAM|nr:hypothetical protein FA95DRAFT_211669 [Auriscalpium vulgare]
MDMPPSPWTCRARVSAHQPPVVCRAAFLPHIPYRRPVDHCIQPAGAQHPEHRLLTSDPCALRPRLVDYRDMPKTHSHSGCLPWYRGRGGGRLRRRHGRRRSLVLRGRPRHESRRARVVGARSESRGRPLAGCASVPVGRCAPRHSSERERGLEENTNIYELAAVDPKKLLFM